MSALPVRAAALMAGLLALAACDAAEPTATPPVGASAASPTAPSPAAPPPPPPVAATPPPVEKAARPQGSMVESPDGRTMALIYYSLAGGRPPESWAAQEASSGALNEFDRQAKTKAVREDLTAQLAQAGQIGRLKVPVRSDISQYDAARGVYYVGLFSGASSLGFDYHGQNYRLEFVNKDKAQAWRLPADEAQRALESNGGSRSVIVTVTVELLSAYAKTDGGAIRARVLDYSVENPSTSALLGRVEVPQT